MSTYPWEKAPFFSNSGLLQKDHQTDLPFSVGAFSRIGHHHLRYGMNNQDAIQVVVEPNLIIGVLCDGTSSSSEKVLRTFSNNEVGANLISLIITNLCQSLIQQWKGPLSKAFVNYLSRCFQKKYRELFGILGTDSTKNIVAGHFLTGTCIGFVVVKDQYLVFAAGDGMVNVNGGFVELLKPEKNFISFSLLNRRKALFHVVSTGDTSKLNNLMIASDGIKLKSFYNHKSFNSFITKKSSLKNGFHDMTSEFHTKVLNEFLDGENDKWPGDDTSLIVLQRVKRRSR